MSRVNSVMSTKEFRPRPIDINQPLPIVSDEKLLNEIERETIATTRAPPIRLPKSKAIITVATPLYRDVEDSKSTNTVRFTRPQNYIIHQREQEYDADDLDYELDTADELFLAALNHRIKARSAQSRQLRSRPPPSHSPSASPRPPPSPTPSPSPPPSLKPPIKPRREAVGTGGVTDDMLEQIINGLEREAFFVYGLRQMRDNTMDGILCGVCNDHEGDPSNALVLCDGCGTPVHQHCYGIPELPVATWLCDHCVSAAHAQPDHAHPPPVCALCGGRYGGLKATQDGRWAHVLCAMWFPEVVCNDVIIEGITEIHADRWNKTCSLCNDTRGVCIECDEAGCNTQFHVGCARGRGLFVEPRPDGENVTLTAYCSLHSLNHLEHYPTFPRDSERPLGNETALLAKAMGLTEEDFDLIYSYWRIKRRNHPPPLLRRLRALISEGYTLRFDGPDAEEEYSNRFVKLRQDFERARMLLDLVRKRELAKRQMLDALHSLVVFHTEGGGGEGDEEMGEYEDEDEEMEDQGEEFESDEDSVPNNVEEDEEEEEEEEEEEDEEYIHKRYPRRSRH